MSRKIWESAHHKISNGSVKFSSIVVTILAVLHEIFARLWHNVAVEFEIQCPEIRQKSDIAWEIIVTVQILL